MKKYNSIKNVTSKKILIIKISITTCNFLMFKNFY